MFSRSRPVTFNPYGRRPSRWRWMRWIVLPLLLVLAGGVGVIVLQERYLPPRLTAEASQRLLQDVDGARGEAQRLSAALAQAQQQLQASGDRNESLSRELAVQKAEAERLQADLAAVVAVLPPDPRNGTVEVRAARFAASGGMLAYDLVLTRDEAQRGRKAPLQGTLQLVVTGESSKQGATTVTMKPIPLSMGPHEVVRGSQPLPEGFRPQHTTVRVLDKPAGQLLGMRQWIVR